MAAVLSGLPSTVYALWRRQPLLDTVRAAGNVVLPASAPGPLLVLAAGPVHGALSLGWGAVLGLVLPRRHEIVSGALAGLGIAALDLGLIGRRRPLIAALPQAPQVLDHVAFGAVAGAVIGRRRRRAPSAGTG